MPEFGVLDFERPIYDLEEKVKELRKMMEEEGLDLSSEIKHLESKADELRRQIFANLDPWQRVQVARHPRRPYTYDYVKLLITDFVEVHGDRQFADDRAILTGFGRLGGQSVCIAGHQKGRTTKENLWRNFGSPHPEGFRKAIRVMKIADKFNIPILTFLDTAGAYPGIEAEERGQAEAIARNIKEMFTVGVPIIVNIIGEGGSGGALGIGVGNVVLMLSNAYYSVISPEGCAAILWRDRAQAPTSSRILRISAPDLLKLKVIDEIVEEPLGGAHTNYAATAQALGQAISRHLQPLLSMSREELVEHRRKHFRGMGYTSENPFDSSVFQEPNNKGAEK